MQNEMKAVTRAVFLNAGGEQRWAFRQKFKTRYHVSIQTMSIAQWIPPFKALRNFLFPPLCEKMMAKLLE